MICIIQISRSRLQSTWVALMRFREVTYFGGELIKRTKVELRVKKLKNGQATGKDRITEELIIRVGDMVMDWICRLFNMTFESVVV